eukprot:5224758-Prymnesium_polylepis.2
MPVCHRTRMVPATLSVRLLSGCCQIGWDRLLSAAVIKPFCQVLSGTVSDRCVTALVAVSRLSTMSRALQSEFGG